MTDFKLPKKDQMTEHQLKLRRIICEFRDDLIGGIENVYSDRPDDFENEYPHEELTKDWAVDTIYDQIMDNYGRYLVATRTIGLVLEKKHVKFMGKQFVRALIADRIEYDYQHGGWNFPNNYSGVNPYKQAIEQLKSSKYYHFKDATRERWFEIVKVRNSTVQMLELSNQTLHTYKLEGDVLKEMVDDKTGFCENERGQ